MAPKWVCRFPELFDEDDVRLAKSQPRGHFVEWVGAIVLYHTTGYLWLVEKYEFANHRRKQEIVEKLRAASELLDAALPIRRDPAEHGSTQAPDLPMYARDFSDWFFCEVKGPGDSLRAPQERKFEDLAAMTGKPVRLLWLKWARVPRRAAGGRTGEKSASEGVTSGKPRQWDKESFFADLLEKRGEEETGVARDLYDWTLERGWKPMFRGGMQQGSWTPVLAVNGREWRLIMIDTHPSGRIQVLFQYLQRYPPFDDERRRLELRRRINEIPGVSFGREVITARPPILLHLLAGDVSALEQLKLVLEWFEVEVGNTS